MRDRATPGPDERLAMVAIREAPEAIARASDLRRRGVSDDALDGLARLKLAVSWQAPDGVYWTLTPYGAEWLGVMLDELRDGRPEWVDRVPEERRPPRPVRAYGPAGQRSLPREDLVRAARIDEPIADALAREYLDLIARFEAGLIRDPGGAREALGKAESIVAGTISLMKERYVWDPAEDRPLVLAMPGQAPQALRRDRRMKRGGA